jgi:hypothetical protein
MISLAYYVERSLRENHPRLAIMATAIYDKVGYRYSYHQARSPKNF